MSAPRTTLEAASALMREAKMFPLADRNSMMRSRERFQLLQSVSIFSGRKSPSRRYQYPLHAESGALFFSGVIKQNCYKSWVNKYARLDERDKGFAKTAGSARKYLLMPDLVTQDILPQLAIGGNQRNRDSFSGIQADYFRNSPARGEHHAEGVLLPIRTNAKIQSFHAAKINPKNEKKL